MTKLRVHFDGRALIPEEPVELPIGQSIEIYIDSGEEESPLLRLVKIAESLPNDPDAPTDAAAQHDHFLYGTPKKP